jgi:hypothetical protein
MVAACGGPGPDTLVLAWLCRVLHTDPPGPNERRFLGRCQGKRCVAATHTGIANELGISARQVRTALTSLRNLGIVKTRATKIRLVAKAVEKVKQECRLRDNTGQ